MSRADADVVIKLDVRDGAANASLAAFEARLQRLERSGKNLGASFDSVSGKIDEATDALQNFEQAVERLDKKSLKSLDKELVQKKKDLNEVGKASKGSSRDLDTASKSVDRFNKAIGRGQDNTHPFMTSLKTIGRFAKIAGIEFLALSGAIGAMTLALKAGQLVMKGWDYLLKGVAQAAGTAVAAVAAVLGAIREYQYATMLPMFKATGTPLAGATDARSRMSMFMGGAGLGLFSDKAIQQSLSAAMGNGQRANPQLMGLMKTLGNFTVGGNMEKSLPALVQAFTAAMAGGGKITADIFAEIQSSSPAVAKVFAEMAGGQEQLLKKLDKGKITVDDFMAAFKKGELESIKPFIGALDAVNETLFGRLKNNAKELREQLVAMGDPLVEALKEPLDGLANDLRVFGVRITPVIQRTFTELLGGTGGDTIDRMFMRLASSINENLPKILDWGKNIRSAVNWTKDLFSSVGDYIRKFDSASSTLWNKIFKPLGSEFVKTLDHLLVSFGATIDAAAPFADNFEMYIARIGEGVRSLIDGLNNIKKALAPIVDAFLRLLAVISSLMSVGGGVGTVVSTLLGGLAFGGMISKGSKGRRSPTNPGGGGLMSSMMYNLANVASLGMLGGARSARERRAAGGGGRSGMFGAGYRSAYGAGSNSAYAQSLLAARRRERYARHSYLSSTGLDYNSQIGGYLKPGVAEQFNRMDDGTYLHRKYRYGVNDFGNPTINGREVDERRLARIKLTREELIQKTGGLTTAQGQEAYATAVGGPGVLRQHRAQTQRDAAKAAKAAGREQGRAFLKTTAKEFGRQAGPLAAGLAITAVGGYVSSKVDGADRTGQMAAGILSGAGQGAMLGSMLGPWGAAAGAVIGGGISGVMSWKNAEKEQQRRNEEATARAREFGTANVVMNDRQSLLDQMTANRETLRTLSADSMTNLQDRRHSLETQIRGLVFGGTMGENGVISNVDSEQYREIYRTLDMRFNDWAQGTEDIFYSFNQKDTNKRLQSLLSTDLITEKQRSMIEEYLEKTQKLSEVQGLAGKSAQEQAAAASELEKVNKELQDSYERFGDNLFILQKTMGMTEEEAANFANTMNIDLAGAFVNMDTIMAGLGYTADEFANRATAAGRLLEEALSTVSSRRGAIESDMRFDAAGQRLFNTKAGGFESENDAKLAAIDFAEAFMEQRTAERIDPSGKYFNMNFEQYTAEMMKDMEGYYNDLVASGADKTAIDELSRALFGYVGGPRRELPGGPMPMGGMYGTVQNARGSLEGLLKYDEKGAAVLSELIRKAGESAMAGWSQTGGAVDPKTLAENRVNEIVNNPAFKDLGLNAGTDVKNALAGLILGEMDQGALGIGQAIQGANSALISALRSTRLNVGGSVSGTVAVVDGGDTASVRFTFSGGSGGSGDSPTASRFGGNPQDTTSSRWARTLGAHNQMNALLPGSRTITSGVRNHNLGSLMSDHRFGRAYDLTGDNLGQYANIVNDAGGFAEFHGSAGSRHLHVVPPAGDAMNPAMVGATAGASYTYNVTVNAGSSASPQEIADTVMRQIKRTERSDRERN